MVKDIIFDFFGTLVHYHPVWFKHRHDKTFQAIQKLGWPLSYEEFVQCWVSAYDSLETSTRVGFFEFHLNDVFRACLEPRIKTKLTNDELERLSELFSLEWNDGTSYIQGLNEMLTHLAQEYRLSIISNVHFPRLIQHNLRVMGVEKLFHTVVTSAEVGHRKPGARIFTSALSELNINAEQAVYIGDSYEADYLGASAAGLRCILIDPSNKYNGTGVRTLQSILELPKACGGFHS